jgi:hypothetical protein
MMTTVTELARKESNGRDFLQCPYCSKMYPVDDVPSSCKRCTSPMDPKRAGEFADAQAAREYSPVVQQLGDGLRGTRSPERPAYTAEGGQKKPRLVD